MRFFIEVSYNGANYSGFQTQQNANTIQAEIEKAMAVLTRQEIRLTGSSRTDAGVHAIQNYFHFDTNSIFNGESNEIVKCERLNRFLYNLNAIIPQAIAIKNLLPVPPEAHCRFDALAREYKYYIYRKKNPFLNDRAYFFPYSIDFQSLQAAADLIKGYSDFSSFSKKRTQVKSFECKILESKWFVDGECLVYHVKANRFLRGMVRALTATMLKIGRGKLSLEDFKTIIEARDSSKSSFAVPAHGLFLETVEYPPGYFNKNILA
jgi:tRNA pseudouridine38-40 synthase